VVLAPKAISAFSHRSSALQPHFLPDFASFGWIISNQSWLVRARRHFTCSLSFLGGRIGAKIKETMRFIWNPIIDKPNIPVPVPRRRI
jgi:hypothetical protein